MPVPKRHQRFCCRCRCRLGTFQYQFSTKSITASPTMPIAIILACSFYAKRSSLKSKIFGLSPAILISKSTFPHTFFRILPQLLFYTGTCQSFPRACYFLFPWRKIVLIDLHLNFENIPCTVKFLGIYLVFTYSLSATSVYLVYKHSLRKT